MTRIRPTPRRRPGPACPPPASHATPPARFTDYRRIPDVEVQMPARQGRLSMWHIDVSALRQHFKLKEKPNNDDGCFIASSLHGFSQLVVEQARRRGIEVRAFVDPHSEPAVITHYYRRKELIERRPIGAKLAAALGWPLPSLD